MLTQHVLIFENDNWDVVVTRAFEDCQPDCLEYLEVGGGIASINCMASAMVTTLEGGGGTGSSGWVEQTTSVISSPSEPSIASMLPLSESSFMLIKTMSFSLVDHHHHSLSSKSHRNAFLGQVKLPRLSK